MGTLKRIVVAAGLIRRSSEELHGDRYLMSRRLNDAHLAGWWEFPGGKVEPGESPHDALRRELKEELDIEVNVGPIFAVGHHLYSDREVILLVYEVVHLSGEPRCLGVSEYAWLAPEDLLAA